MKNINQPERGVINSLLDLGRFVVVTHYPKYCPVTDASVGEIMSAVGSFDSYEVAQAFCDGYQPSPDERVTIECPAEYNRARLHAMRDERIARAMASIHPSRGDDENLGCPESCPF